jgi:thermitase
MSARPKPSAALAFLGVVALSACNTTTPVAPQVRSDSQDYVYALPIDITPADTRTDLETRLGGKVVIFEPDMGFAVIGFENEQAARRADDGNTRLEPNKGVFLGGGQMAWMNGSVSAWAGGSVSAWAGGSISAWAGGSVSAWAGGNYTYVPQNSFKWRQIHLEQGQRLATNLGSGIKVAVIDTGVDLDHPAFGDAILRADMWDFVGNDPIPQEEGTLGVGAYGHGTNVTGIVLQIAPRAKVLPLRVLGPDGRGDVTRVAAAINYAVAKGARVINLSLGSDNPSQTVKSAIDAATKKGVIVVASSGNTGDENVTFPANDAYIERTTAGELSFSVGSVDADDLKSTFSTYGKKNKPLEIVAPGEFVYAPAPDNRMAAWSGTSMAAPMISGALALALGQPLVVNTSELLEKLRGAATDIYNNNMNESYKDRLGKGRLNIQQFLLDSIAR